MSAFVKDLLERVIWTFLQAVAGLVVLAPSIDDLTFWKGAMAAGVAAVASLVKGVAAKQLNNGTASSAPGL